MNDFANGSVTEAGVADDEIVGPQDGSPVNKFGSVTIGANSASCIQVIEKNVANKSKRKVDNVVAAVQNRFEDAILTSTDSCGLTKG